MEQRHKRCCFRRSGSSFPPLSNQTHQSPGLPRTRLTTPSPAGVAPPPGPPPGAAPAARSPKKSTSKIGFIAQLFGSKRKSKPKTKPLLRTRFQQMEDQDVRTLISLYYKQENLYNPKNSFYGNRVVEEDCYNDMVRSLPAYSAACLRDGIQVLRNLFEREYTIIEGARRRTGEVITPSIPYYNELLFLVPHLGINFKESPTLQRRSLLALKTDIVEPKMQPLPRPSLSAFKCYIKEPEMQPVQRPIEKKEALKSDIKEPQMPPVQRPSLLALKTDIKEPQMQPVQRPLLLALKHDIKEPQMQPVQRPSLLAVKSDIKKRIAHLAEGQVGALPIHFGFRKSLRARNREEARGAQELSLEPDEKSIASQKSAKSQKIIFELDEVSSKSKKKNREINQKPDQATKSPKSSSVPNEKSEHSGTSGFGSARDSLETSCKTERQSVTFASSSGMCDHSSMPPNPIQIEYKDCPYSDLAVQSSIYSNEQDWRTTDLTCSCNSTASKKPLNRGCSKNGQQVQMLCEMIRTELNTAPDFIYFDAKWRIIEILREVHKRQLVLRKAQPQCPALKNFRGDPNLLTKSKPNKPRATTNCCYCHRPS